MDVKTAGRTLDIFELFAEVKRPLTLSEIARALSMPQSSCFNLVRALEARGYLYSAGGKKRLYPTRRVFDCAKSIACFEPVLARMEPVLDRLRDETDETAILGAWHGDKVIYLGISEGRQTIRYVARVGDIKPVHSSAVGKALLTTLSEEKRRDVIDRLELDKRTGRTITEPGRLLDDVTRAQHCGYAHTSGEGVADVSAVASPVLVDQVAYAVAIAGPSGRVDPNVGALGRALQMYLADIA